MKHKADKKKRSWISTLILVILLLAGVGIMAYPTVSDWWNSMHQSQLVADYDAAVANLDETDYEAMFAEAEQYNRDLLSLDFPFSDYETLQGEYESALNATGNGMIGYVTIEKIDVKLPIYHGTSEAVLNTSAGHLEGSCLPVGGKGRHTVISAHRGLPSAKLFTNLDRLELGDTFSITVLNQLFTYEVDQILIVEPGETEELNVVQGQDYVTLLTCTPYGINTHRMMVRGTRIENPAGEVRVQAEATKVAVYVAIGAVAVPLLFVLLLVLLIVYKHKGTQITLEDIRAVTREQQEQSDRSEEE